MTASRTSTRAGGEGRLARGEPPMSDLDLHAAARALAAILRDRRPDLCWTVEVEPEDDADDPVPMPIQHHEDY
jgi:hypothetical protein